VFCLEEVFAEMHGAQISSSFPVEQSRSEEKLERSAFVFITAELGSSNAAFEDLRQIDGVKEIYYSRGAYDLIAKVSGKSMEHLREIVFRQIKSLSSIKATLTLTVI
jgi:DNA-binding Lrp family transcriptional regulator